VKGILVGIGGAKCATTWVHDNLRHHPKVSANPIKEIHYFDQTDATDPMPFPHRITQVQSIYADLRKDSSRAVQHAFAIEWLERYLAPVPMNEHWYLSLFAHVPDDSIAIDISPGYSVMSLDGFRHLRCVLPKARILFQMRNPVERCWSQFRKDVLDVTNKPFTTDQMIRILDKPQYIYIFYGQTLEHLSQTFEASDVMCAFSEDIVEDPTNFLRSLCAFVGIEFDLSYFPELDDRVNETHLKTSMPPEVRAHLRCKYRRTYELVADQLGRVPLAWQKEFD
jgi:hypothetical protein